MNEEIEEEIYTYFNDELPQDFESLMKILKGFKTKLGNLILTVPVDMEVASPDDDILNVFGGHCLEISEALDDMIDNEKNILKRLQELEKLHKET